MNKPWIHADLLEFVANLADLNCSATISDGVMTLEDGTQIDLYALLPQPQEKTMTNLNELAIEYYKKNVELIKREGGPSYSDWDVHEQAMEWTLDDLAGDIHELLDEVYEEQKGT